MLNDMQLDAIKEVGNIGAGNAATALAEMTSMKIDITVPKVLVEEIEDIPLKLGGSETISVGIYFGIEGDLNGNIILFLPVEGALKMIDIMMFMEQGTNKEIDEMGQSALMELGNILASSYLNALSGLTGTYLLPTPPNYTTETVGGMINNILNNMGLDVDRTIFVATEFTESSVRVEGGLLFLLTPQSLSKLFSIMGLE
ncbi:MAG: chemotaxis protein CheC [Candidatus Eremiobacterota bacterium]